MTTRRVPRKKDRGNLGLTAIGSDGDWEVAIDETTSGAQQWFAQIEGRSCYLYFPVRSPLLLGEMIQFLMTKPTTNGSGTPAPRSRELSIGKNADQSVSLLRDDEFSDR